MERKKRGRGRPPGARFSRKLPVYDTDEGIGLLQELAQHRGISAAAVVRQLVREEAQRIGLRPPPASPPYRPAAEGGEPGDAPAEGG